MDNTIFKPTNEYKQMLILDAISTNSKVTQRFLASITNTSVAMVNSYLDDYESLGLIEKNVANSKVVRYLLTKKGSEQLKYLSVNYLKASIEVYNQAKKECIRYLNILKEHNIHNVLFYGAGKVCEMLLRVIKEDDLDFNVLGIVDDDEKKIGTELYGIDIISISQIRFYKYDCIFVSSYNHKDEILENLSFYNISPRKIRSFFE